MSHMYKRLLVAVDGSELSYKALAHVVAIAETFGSELKIVTVVPHQRYYSGITGSSHNENIFFDIQDKLVPIYRKILTNAEAKVKSENPDMNVSTILMEGQPSIIIVEVAEKEECDMIIMGCRRLGGILSLLEENTSRSVINTSKIPVMIIM
ncbi:unnamed protein product [marine sediment metagenome]|uniref:UspA domain-containing protein n=1 Tax=marine sediment metagenome TaxID=412755 RepID=X0YUL6_9ZZZZ